MQKEIEIQTQGKALYLISSEVEQFLGDANISGKSGLLNCFVKHTSCSLIIQENADPTARLDLEEFYERLAPENQSWHRHTLEGPDDTTSHLKASLTQTSLNIPVSNGKMNMGIWQGIYLFEHRKSTHKRKLVLTFIEI